MLSLGKEIVKIVLSKNYINQTDSGLGKPPVLSTWHTNSA